MAKEENDFRDPVFVRVDNGTDVKASVVVWRGTLEGEVSVRIQGPSGSVLINADDWEALVSCINAELHRVR